jgi:hypothetical protein
MERTEPRAVQPPEFGEVFEVCEADGPYRHYERLADSRATTHPFHLAFGGESPDG